MKKLLVVFFALSLVLAFSMPATATDVELSGSYYVRGWYDANSALDADSTTANASYQQRLRIGAIFKVARGLKLTTRMDALELTWGADPRMATQNTATGYLGTKAGYNNERTTWDVEVSRLDFATKYGLISVGLWDTNEWGLTFGNNSFTVGSIMLLKPVGKVLLLAKIEKAIENDAKAFGTGANPYSDLDQDNYVAAAIYRTPTLTAGLLYKYVRNATPRDAIAGFDGLLVTLDILSPYVQYKAGDFYVEAQMYWLDGEYETETGLFGPPITAKDVEGLTWYVMGKYKIDTFTVGGLVAFAQGDDPNTNDTEGFALSGGWDWNPCLILWNDDFNYKANGVLGHVAAVGATADAGTDGEMRNAFIYQVFVEAAPMDKLALKASFSYAKADEKPALYVDSDYGTEFDITANYKIYDNLDYMVGFGYFWAGDYYKCDSPTAQIDDTYLLVNKLTLSF